MQHLAQISLELGRHRDMRVDGFQCELPVFKGVQYFLIAQLMGPKEHIQEQGSQVPDEYFFVAKLFTLLNFILFRSLIFWVGSILTLIPTRLITVN